MPRKSTTAHKEQNENIYLHVIVVVGSRAAPSNGKILEIFLFVQYVPIINIYAV